MASTNKILVNPGYFILGLVVIFVCAAFELFFHAFLYPKPNILDDRHVVVGVTAAFFATLLILVLFLFTRLYARKIQSEKLLDLKKEWENTFNTLADYVSVHDKNFKIVKVNNALCEFLGKNPEEILGTECYRLFHDMDGPYENCPHKKTSEIGHPVSEVINDKHIGVPLQITCSPLFNEDGTFQGTVHIARVHETVDANKRVLDEIIPICASCKNIRNSENEWLSPENYFNTKHGCSFTHTLCRNCQKKLYPEYLF